MSVVPFQINTSMIDVPIPDEATLKAAKARNAAERRLLDRLLRLCWAREREASELAEMLPQTKEGGRR